MCWQDGGEVPRQEFEDAVNGMIGDAFENVAKVEFRVEAVELGCTEQGINRSSTFSAGIRTGEQIVLPAQSDSPDILPMSARN
jgi:hypothetical protein